MSADVELAAGVVLFSGRVAAGVAVKDAGGFRVLSRASAPSCALSDGVPTDFPAFSEAVRSALSEAASLAGAEIFSAAGALGGPHVKGAAARGAVYLGTSPRPVNEEDTARALRSAGDVQLPSDRALLDVLPVAYAVDEARGLGNPVGLEGLRLECEALAVTCSAAALSAFNRAMAAVPVKAEFVTSSAWAGVRSLLSPPELASRTLVVDLESDGTDVLLLQNLGPRLLVTLPNGFDALVSAVARRFNIPTEAARSLLASSCRVSVPDDFLLERGAELEVPPSAGFPGAVVTSGELWDLAGEFFSELFDSVARTLELRELGSSVDSVVLAGWAAAAEGSEETARSRLDAPARRAVHPAGEPSAHRLDGLLRLVFQRRREARQGAGSAEKGPSGPISRILRFLSDLF